MEGQAGAGDRDRVVELLGSRELEWVLRIVAARVADGDELSGPVALLTATAAQRTAAAALFGRRPLGRSATLRLEDLDALLRESGAWPEGLASAVAALDAGVAVLPQAPPATTAPAGQPPVARASGGVEPGVEPAGERVVGAGPDADAVPGPVEAVVDLRTVAVAEPDEKAPGVSGRDVPDRVAAPDVPAPVAEPEVAGDPQAWAEAWATLQALPTEPVDWLAWWRTEVATGVPARLAGTADAAQEVALALVDVLALLPAQGELLADLAEAVTGSTRALEDGPLAALVGRALRWHAGRSTMTDDEAWAAVGVVRDELASTVVTLGLPVQPSGPTGAALTAWGAVGQPVVLTFRQLRLHPPRWRPAPSGGAVRLCSTADLLALAEAGPLAPDQDAARAVGADGATSVAAQVVLRGLRDAGWQVHDDRNGRDDTNGRDTPGGVPSGAPSALTLSQAR